MFTTANPEADLSNQEKVRYLKRYTLLDKEINRKLEEVTRWRSYLVKITTVPSTQPKGGGSIYSRTEDIMSKIVDLEAELNREIDQLVELKQNIDDIIAAIEDDRERLLLQYRYIDGKTFEWIAAEMELSWQWVHNLHSKALEKIYIT